MGKLLQLKPKSWLLVELTTKLGALLVVGCESNRYWLNKGGRLSALKPACFLARASRA